MSWEVRTMQSKTSYFNATLFRKNLTRFWPLWGLASFVGALFPLAVLLDMVHRGWNVLSAPDFTGMYYDAVSAVPVINLVYAALCAMAVWSYLYNARSVGLMHTLPIRREGLFLTNFLSGLSMTLIPYAVTGVLCVVVSLCGGAFDAKGLAVTVLAVLGESFFYFSSATFVAFITGNAFAMPPLYALLHFLAVLLDWLISSFAQGFIFGFSTYYTGGGGVALPHRVSGQQRPVRPAVCGGPADVPRWNALHLPPFDLRRPGELLADRRLRPGRTGAGCPGPHPLPQAPQ